MGAATAAASTIGCAHHRAGRLSDAERIYLLHADRGLGDTLQCIRYGRLVADRGARVVVECQPRLTRPLGTLPEIDPVVATGDALAGLASVP